MKNAPAAFRPLMALTLSVALLAGCAGREGPDKESLGTVIGATIGALVGSQFGSGAGQSVSIAVGSIAGLWLGGEIGRALDERDRAMLDETTLDTLEMGQVGERGSWSNPDSGNSGSVVPKRTYETKSGAQCREFETTVMVDGQEETAIGEACRRDDGTWQIVR